MSGHERCTLGPSGDGWTHAVCSCGRHLGARRTEVDAVGLWVDHRDAALRQSAGVDALPVA